MELQPRGEVTERFKVLASKASVRETVPWVRIPPSPPYINNPSIVTILDTRYVFCYVISRFGVE